MILTAQFNKERLLFIVANASPAFANCDWCVASPLFIRFSSEEEHDARGSPLGGGKSAYWLSAVEIADMVRTDSIGFDWTDVAVICEDSSDEAVVMYVQCVDAGKMYVWTSNQGLRDKLANNGFANSGLLELPFGMENIKNVRKGGG